MVNEATAITAKLPATPAVRGKHSKGKKLQIFIQFPDGEAGEVDLLSSHTIIALKENIEWCYGHNPVTTKLIFEGKELEHDKNLSNYDVQIGSIVNACIFNPKVGPCLMLSCPLLYRGGEDYDI